MENVIIKNKEEMEKYLDSDGNCTIKGNLIAKCNVTNTASLYVMGYIEADGYIKAGWYIEAGGYIKASYVLSLNFDITCKKLITKKVPFCRKYYAQMPPLKKYKDHILDPSMCWGSLRELLKPDAKKIVKWNGWHPIVRAQIKMFFELCKEVDGKELL